MGRAGKRSLLTTRKRQTFLAALAEGQRRQQAARIAGISPYTIEQWIARGNGRHERPATPLYVEFVRDVEFAEAEAETKALRAVVGAFKRDIRAAIWFLESRSPEWRQGRLPPGPPAVQIGSNTGTTQVVVVDAETLNRLARQKLGEISAPPADERARLVEDTGAPG